MQNRCPDDGCSVSVAEPARAWADGLRAAGLAHGNGHEPDPALPTASGGTGAAGPPGVAGEGCVLCAGVRASRLRRASGRRSSLRLRSHWGNFCHCSFASCWTRTRSRSGTSLSTAGTMPVSATLSVRGCAISWRTGTGASWVACSSRRRWSRCPAGTRGSAGRRTGGRRIWSGWWATRGFCCFRGSRSGTWLPRCCRWRCGGWPMTGSNSTAAVRYW